MFARIFSVLSVVMLLLLVGCSDRMGMEAVPEREERSFKRAQSRLQEGRSSEALADFLRVIEKRPDAAESHLEAGRLFDGHLNDPVSAIYHYRRFLELRPDSSQTPLVEQMIETSKKNFARQLPGQPFNTEIDRLDLLELLKESRAENTRLKEELASVRARLNQYEQTRIDSPLTATTPSTAPASTTRTPVAATTQTTRSQQRAAATPAQSTTYVVEAGDTLSRISSKVYGTPGRWQDIFQANRDVLPSPHALKVGQTLKIPRE